MAQSERQLVDPLEIIDEDQERLKPLRSTMGSLEDANGLERDVAPGIDDGGVLERDDRRLRRRLAGPLLVAGRGIDVATARAARGGA